MRLSGSCNAKVYAVSPFTYLPAMAGDEILDRGRYTRLYASSNAAPYVPFLRNDPEGEVRYWMYDHANINPQIWVSCDSSWIIHTAWESESNPDELDPTFCPIADESIPGGEKLLCVFPGYSFDSSNPAVLDQIDDLLESSDAPSWATGTVYDGKSACSICEALFRSFCIDRELYLPTSFSNVHRYNRRRDSELRQYTLLWLRASSMVLHDHRGISCIPLILNNFIVAGRTLTIAD